MITDKMVCPLCESGKLIPRQTVEHYCYKGHHFSLANIEYSECPSCHSEIVTPEQIKHNEVRVRDEHRKIDELSISAEIAKQTFVLVH
jgi:YgiT-type zinc finger domain-containing protein